MNSTEIHAIKSRINTTLLKRNGVGDVSMFAGVEYDFATPGQGEEISSDIGQKTIDLLLHITGDRYDRKNFVELGGLTESGGAIPATFNLQDINRICDALDADVDDPRRGTAEEVNHCNGACTGLCEGCCISMCNGCSGCMGGCSSSCEATSAGITQTGGVLR